MLTSMKRMRMRLKMQRGVKYAAFAASTAPRNGSPYLKELVGVLFFLYFFLFGLELLGSGAKVLTGCAAGAMFGDDTNPIAGLTIGILTTVLLQSSSTATSIIVSLVGSGAIAVEPAIYMVMGANIGTSVTNTIVAMGQMGDGDLLERAFAGATVHDMFNFMTVAILLPVEAATHYLAALAYTITKNATVLIATRGRVPSSRLCPRLLIW
jgi:sodium-dependent phosphate cotransporter